MPQWMPIPSIKDSNSFGVDVMACGKCTYSFFEDAAVRCGATMAVKGQ